MSELAQTNNREFADDPRTARILHAVLRSFENGGYESVNLRSVAGAARVSLTTVYRLYPSRDALRVAAIEYWMQHNVYEPLPMPDPAATIPDRVIDVLRGLFEPWLRQPAMLAAFSQALMGPGGDTLQRKGMLATEVAARSIFEGTRRGSSTPTALVVHHVLYSLLAHHAQGKISVRELLPTLETTVRLLDWNGVEPDSAAWLTVWPLQSRTLS